MNPRQTLLCRIDVFALLAEVLDWHDKPIIDGGAHTGEASKAIRRHFPRAPIHMFEPVSRCYAALMDQAEGIGNVRAYRCAIGEKSGAADMHINRNLWTCSLLPASQRGHDIHGDWCETVDTESVDVVRLDEWAREEGVAEVGILKLDLQGAELPALRGAGELLRTVQAVYCEAQIIPEYEGASTFAEIDLFLRGTGFGLYQIADLCMKGRHAEPSCCDGLWLRNDVLERVRASREPRAVSQHYDVRPLHMADALVLCEARGLKRVAIFGAGAHTAACGSVLAYPSVEIAAIIDDSPRHSTMWGLPVVTLERALGLDLDAVVLSSDLAEPVLLGRVGPFIERGTPVVALYAGGRPAFVGGVAGSSAA